MLSISLLWFLFLKKKNKEAKKPYYQWISLSLSITVSRLTSVTVFFLETESHFRHPLSTEQYWSLLGFLNAVLQSPWILFPSLKMWIPLFLETVSLVRLTQHPPCLFCVAGQVSIVLLVLSGTVLTATDLEVALCILQFSLNLEKNVST